MFIIVISLRREYIVMLCIIELMRVVGDVGKERGAGVEMVKCKKKKRGRKR